MSESIEQLLGTAPKAKTPTAPGRGMRFSFLFFSDVRKDMTDRQKYDFTINLTEFADQAGFEAIYIPERHFYEFGSIYANPAIMAAHLIPRTSRVRFRTAGVTLPLHHPVEVVEWWAMNDVLSGGRVDLGFGSGWAARDFVTAPDNYPDRRRLCSERIQTVQRLWRGEAVPFVGPDGQETQVTVYPRPLQKELNVWLLVTQSDAGFEYAGRMGYNVFTMLYGNNLETMQKKFSLYRQARAEAGLDPQGGTISLALHTLLLDNGDQVRTAVEEPFRNYIRSALDAHVTAAAAERKEAPPDETERRKMLDYAFERYYSTGALFGSLDDGKAMVGQAIAAGVDEIACLVDFGVDYQIVQDATATLAQLVQAYRVAGSSTSTSSSAK